MGLIKPYDWQVPDGLDVPDIPEDLRVLAQGIAGDLDRVESDLTPRVGAIEALGLNGNELRVLSTFNGGAGTNVTTVASGIPGNYEHLMLIWRGGSNLAQVGASLSMRFNNNSVNGNYAGFNGWATASGWTLQDESSGASSVRAGFVGSQPGSTGSILIPYYTNTTGGSIKAESLARGVGGSGAAHAYGIGVGVWSIATPSGITSIQLWPAASTWNASGVRVSLIGIK